MPLKMVKTTRRGTPKRMNAIPKDIEFYLPAKTRADGDVCRVTETLYGGNRTTLLSLCRSSLSEAGLEGGDRVILLRGKPPHNRWIRVEKAKYGKKLPEKGAVSLSLKSFIKANLGLKNEMVTPITGDGAIYFELPASWLV